jgi:hypothetical protein
LLRGIFPFWNCCVKKPTSGYIRSKVLSLARLLPIISNFHKSLPHLLLTKRVVTANLPKKLLELNNSLKDKAETSLPLTEVRLANSKTGLDSAITDLDKLISTPNSLQSQR